MTISFVFLYCHESASVMYQRCIMIVGTAVVISVVTMSTLAKDQKLFLVKA